MSVYTVDYGHALRGSVGARGNGYLEEVETRKIGKLVTQKLRSLGHTVHEIYLDDAVDMTTDLNFRVNKINSIKPDMSVSIHLNAFSNPSANGVEVWSDKYVWNTAANIGKEIASSLGLNNRGVKDGTDNLALVGLYGGSTPALLVECLFMTNASDMAKYNVEKIATAIVKGITGKTVSEPTPTPQPSGDLCRIIVNGKNIIALTGLQKCIDHVKANYPKEEVKIQRVSDNVVLWTQAKYVAPAPVGEYKTGEKWEKGTFYPNDTIYFRNKPYVGSDNPTQGIYTKGEKVHYDYVVITNKYVWISWISGSGVRRYMPIREVINGVKQGMWGYIV